MESGDDELDGGGCEAGSCNVITDINGNETPTAVIEGGIETSRGP